MRYAKRVDPDPFVAGEVVYIVAVLYHIFRGDPWPRSMSNSKRDGGRRNLHKTSRDVRLMAS